MSNDFRNYLQHTARRIHFLLPDCPQRNRLATLLDPEFRVNENSIGGRTRGLLACLNGIQRALLFPESVPPKDRLKVERPRATLVLALLKALSLGMDGATNPAAFPYQFQMKEAKRTHTSD